MMQPERGGGPKREDVLTAEELEEHLAAQAADLDAYAAEIREWLHREGLISGD